MRYTQEQISTALVLLKATGSPDKVIQTLGYPSSPMKKMTANLNINPNDITSAEDINELKAQMLDMQMEIDILKETINVLKKDPGIDQTALTNREKAVIIDALKNKDSLLDLLKKLNLAKSGYYYQEKAIHIADKYFHLRKRIIQLFHENRNIFGYRRIHMLLQREGRKVSEKVVRRIMKRENLIIRRKRRQKYNSYKGELTPAVENIIDRNFHATKPNEKCLTDITEFSIKPSKRQDISLQEISNLSITCVTS